MGNINLKFILIQQMKTAALLALLGSASAQLTFCESIADCEGAIDEGGCCARQEVLEIPEAPEWGFIETGVFQGGPIEVGSAAQICFGSAFVEARASHDNQGDNVLDLQ